MSEISAKNREDYLQRLKRFRPIDDIFMRRLFNNNIPLTELVLRIIMNKKDLKVLSVTTQADNKQVTGARSVTFDIDATDADGKKYDIEIQNDSRKASPKRARYHASVMDIENLREGQDFEDLPETYVIFITEKDYFGLGDAIYTIDRVLLNNNTDFDDGEHIIYVNGSYDDESDIGKLMHDFRCSDPDDMHYELIKNRTKYCKTNSAEVETMCQVIEELVNKVREEGRTEGKEKTLAGLTAEMKTAGVTEEMIQTIIANYQAKASKNSI